MKKRKKFLFLSVILALSIMASSAAALPVLADSTSPATTENSAVSKSSGDIVSAPSESSASHTSTISAENSSDDSASVSSDAMDVEGAASTSESQGTTDADDDITADSSSEGSEGNTPGESVQTSEISELTEGDEDETDIPNIEYKVSIGSMGTVENYAKNGEECGTAGQGNSLEALWIRLTNLNGMEGSVSYSAEVENDGWQNPTSDDQMAGTRDQSKRIEAVRMELTGDIANRYDIYYCVSVQNLGWLGWAKNGESAGTSGFSCGVESIRIQLVRKDEAAPVAVGDIDPSFYDFADLHVDYCTHVQGKGTLSWVKDGAVSGTSGESRRMEALWAKLETGGIDGGIEYSAHIQRDGWQDYTADGAMAGTTGESKRLEAVQIRLTGKIASLCDVYYQVHVQNLGWLGWAKNGESAGTEGFSYRVEAIRIKLVKKDAGAPASGNTNSAFYDFNKVHINYCSHVQSYGTQGWVTDGALSGTSGQSKRMEALWAKLETGGISGGIEYRTHVQTYGWQSFVSNGAMAGTTGESKRLEAVQIRLTGEIANLCDVYYQVHVQHFGWLGWAKNGASAGTSGCSYRMEAVRIRIVRKGGEAPGSTANAYFDLTPEKAMNQLSGGRQISTVGSFSLPSYLRTSLANDIANIENRGYRTGFMMVDLTTGKGISYNPDVMIYSASSIKGIYVASLCADNPSAGRRSEATIHKILKYSDNDAYAYLRATYGTRYLTDWCNRTGVRQNIVWTGNYTTYSPRELAKLWLQNYKFFQSGSWGSEVGSWFQSPADSPIHEQLGGRYTTRTKAGWYYVNPPFAVANDAGIVYAGSRPYLIVVMSEVPGYLSQLKPLVRDLNAVHDQM